MSNQITPTHTFENGIIILRTSSRGAKLISDGIYTAWVKSSWVRPDGTLTPAAMNALLNSNETIETTEKNLEIAQERREQARKDREEAFLAGKEIVCFEVEPGVIYSQGKCWKYVVGKGLNIYHKLVNIYEYIPKSQMTIRRENNKVYCECPKWLADKHPRLFNKGI